ncbi:MAG: type III-B CRISPR module RAMP protein Cmr1 [Limnochordia bacterium]|nr:type III-B CRISPR module RAMP protein Cmr1 [Limnochordia bacterium]
MRHIEARFRVVTPLFMCKRPQEKAELRISSIRGALRSWYRAIAWPRAYGKDKDWTEVEKEESKLFGSAEGGQSQVLLSFGDRQLPSPAEVNVWRQSVRTPGIRYLGYGVLGENREDSIRNLERAILPKSCFTLRGVFRPGTTDEQIEMLCKSIRALNYFGGLGARSRRGFGSVALESLRLGDQEIYHAPKTRTDLVGQLDSFISELGPLPRELPPYTAFSAKSRIQVVLSELETDVAPSELETDVAPSELKTARTMEKLGKRFMELRKEMKEGEKDKLNALTFNHAKPKSQAKPHPTRVAFGLPHNYHLRDEGIEYEISPIGDNLGKRRASPILFHLHPLDRNCAVIASFLPAQFLPVGAQLCIERSKENNKVPDGMAIVPCDVNLEQQDLLANMFTDQLVKEVHIS